MPEHPLQLASVIAIITKEPVGSSRAQAYEDLASFFLGLLPRSDIICQSTSEPDLSDCIQTAGDFIYVPGRGEPCLGLCVKS